MEKIRIGILQYNIAWEDKEKNKIKILEMVQNAREKNNFDLLVMPEMTLTGFSMDKEKTNLNACDIDFFKHLSVKISSVVLFGFVSENKNKCMVFDKDGSMITEYSKIHLFSFAGEDKIYRPGSEHKQFSMNGFNALPMICYDLRFSYLFWDNAENTDLFIVLANWPASRRNHWITLLKARAIENQAFIIGVNRIGRDLKLDYSGDSMIIGPDGSEILNCENNEGLFTAELEKHLLLDTRSKFPFLKDRLK